MITRILSVGGKSKLTWLTNRSGSQTWFSNNKVDNCLKKGLRTYMNTRKCKKNEALTASSDEGTANISHGPIRPTKDGKVSIAIQAKPGSKQACIASKKLFFHYHLEVVANLSTNWIA